MNDRERRDMDLVAIALRNDLDSDQLEQACRAAGIDPYRASLDEVDQAAKDYYGPPAPPRWY